MVASYIAYFSLIDLVLALWGLILPKPLLITITSFSSVNLNRHEVLRRIPQTRDNIFPNYIPHFIVFIPYSAPVCRSPLRPTKILGLELFPSHL